MTTDQRRASGRAVARSGDRTMARRDEILETAARFFASRGLRTSLHEIADACGIKPGSLYHHFDSKEAIVVELVQRYHDELDRIAESALADLRTSDPKAVGTRLEELGTAIAECAVRHSVAVHFAFNEPPAGASDELVRLASRVPKSIEEAALETLRMGLQAGLIRPEVDLPLLSDRMCQTMLHVGLGLFHRYKSVDTVARQLCNLLLGGVAAAPANAQLDRSRAFAAVEDVIRNWNVEGDEVDGDRSAIIRAVARAEFGRRGYEITTVRDIAAAAGMSTGTVYRVIGSKEDLLTSIMRSFVEKSLAGWDAAFAADATVVEKLDAVAWLHINIRDQFNDEFKIQVAWMRQSPPATVDLGWSFSALLKRLRALLREGEQSGELRIDGASTELTARCVVELSWIPDTIIGAVGKRGALAHQRDTVLRGAAVR